MKCEVGVNNYKFHKVFDFYDYWNHSVPYERFLLCFCSL